MDRNRSLWLTARLVQEADGAAAHRQLAELTTERRERVLAGGDRLAAASVSLAQQYYRRAPVALDSLGGAGFERWFALGEDLALGEPPCREAALAFFSVEPGAFGDSPLDTAVAWCELGRELARTSRKLATIFFRTTARLLARRGALDLLRGWVEVGLRLYGQHGWQGEFLAQAYFSAAPRAVLLFGPRLYQLWAGVGAALYPAVKEREVFGALPSGLHRWSETERELYLRTVLALAALAPRQAYEVYRGLPPALRHVRASIREALLRILVRVGRRAAAAIAEFVPIAGATLQQLPAQRRLEALTLVESLAGETPDCAITALRTLPRLYEEASPTHIPQWFRLGAAVARDNPAAGLAYFALESRTSLRILHTGSTAIDLEEAQGLLRKYVQMLSGEPASLRGVERQRLLLPLEEFPGENEAALPLRVDLLDTHEDNFRVFRFLATQLAGRREFGTYRFVPPGGADPDAPPGSALWSYLDDPQHPDLLQELFLLAEGFRIQCCLQSAYRGLAGEARWVGNRWLARRGGRNEILSDRNRLLDALFAFLLADSTDSWPDPETLDTARLVARLVLPLAVPGASVQDSMLVAQALAEALAAVGVEVAERGGHFDGFFIDKVGGDALIDPWFDDDETEPGEAAPRMAAAQQERKEPTALENLRLELNQAPEEGSTGAQPISPEELKRLLEAGVRLDIRQGAGDDVDGVGLYITDLIGKIPSEQLDELRQLLGDADEAPRRAPRSWLEHTASGPSFFYDEWDYHIGDYRSRWCRLFEVSLEGDSGEFFTRALTDYARLIPQVRRQFQRIRPEMYRTVRGLEDGEDFDLNAAIEARIEIRARRAPSNKLYVARQREERDVATLFLIDMSASTDEPIARFAPGGAATVPAPSRHAAAGQRRVIDVTKEALVIMAAALEEIGDAYAVYGFSGHGRHNVEFYRIKSFSESLTPTVKARIGGIEPKRSTRMGAALRHAVEKISAVNARSKHLFLLSDGFPQDHDYGQDRRSNVYGIRDTTVALRETEAAGVTPFCITVDKAGHDYLREMCEESRYMVIEDMSSLPGELPKIYQRVVRP